MNGAPRPSSYPGTAMPQSPIRSCGEQKKEVWTAPDQGWRPLLELMPNNELWRVSIVGDLDVELSWGTSSRRVLVLAAPVMGDLAGNVSARARPRTTEGATGEVSATNSSGAGPQELRSIVVRVGADVPLHEFATRFVAFVASTLTIRGTAVTLAATQSIPLVSGSVLTSGSGFQEFTP